MEIQPTAYYRREKEVYGFDCFEVHFNEGFLLDIFSQYGLKILDKRDVFWDNSIDFGHRNYLLAHSK